MRGKPRWLSLLSVSLLVFGLGVKPLAADLKFELVAASEEVFAEPHDIVLSPDAKSLYVADNGNHRVVVLDPLTLAVRGRLAEGEVAEPHDLAFDAAGRLLVADTGHSRIAIYRLEGGGGRLVGELSGRIRRPEGVAVHPDGRVFATGAASGNLVVYRDGRVVAEKSGFSSPHDVEFDRAGNVWVADANNDRLVRLNQKLELIGVLSGPAYDFSGPRYMDFDDANRMYLADKYNNSIKVIEAGGRLLQVLGKKTAGKGPGVFDRPEGVEIRGRDVWFSDTYNDRILRYRVSSGTP